MFVLPTYNNVFRLEEQILYVQKMKQTCKSSYFVVCTSKEKLILHNAKSKNGTDVSRWLNTEHS